MTKSILASLTGLGTDRTVLEAAIAVARIEGAHVTCLHARIDVVETAAMIEVTFPQDRYGLDALRQISHEEAGRSQHAKAAFEDAVRQHQLALRDQPGGDDLISVSWRETRSFFNETLDEAHYHDLVVMARDRELSLQRVKSVLLQSGRPLLLAPAKPVTGIGRTIAIAWKTSAEAARAVTSATPLLAHAERVLVLSASQKTEDEDHDRLSAERLAQTLRWQGIKAEARVEYSSGAEARTLQAMAYDGEADLLVMGAYGHNRLREYVLGGVTEDMLADCAIPVFLFR